MLSEYTEEELQEFRLHYAACMALVGGPSDMGIGENRHYVLRNNDPTTPIPATVLEWGAWFEHCERLPELTSRIVARTIVKEGVEVSTVFLGTDHAFGQAPQPVLWETMIFGGAADEYQERYSSYAAAVRGHQRAIQVAQDEIDAEVAWEENRAREAAERARGPSLRPRTVKRRESP